MDAMCFWRGNNISLSETFLRKSSCYQTRHSKMSAAPQPPKAPPRPSHKEPEPDPEVIMRQKFRAKCRFRALVRMVLANAYWMLDDADDYEGLDNVKRRVAKAVRGKTKTKQLLNIHDKVLLNKPADQRTDSEKRYIYRIIGGLKCFKRYPNNVKKKLAAVTYFKYYGPNRVIVRQKHDAHALYFIVTGDVIVSQMIFDELLQQHVSIDVGVMTVGDMFGEVSLLHNIPRTATCTTSGHCEFLILMKEDFKSVLQASVQKQWDEVRRAMSSFTYFDTLDEVARREGCIVAKLKSYKEGETILGDGVGVSNFVYFILSGTCVMIETLKVIVTHISGHTYYTLYDPVVETSESDEDLMMKYLKRDKSSSQKSQCRRESVSFSNVTQDLNQSASTKSNKPSMGEVDSNKSCISKRISGSGSLSEDLSKIDNTDTEETADILLPSTSKEKRQSVRYSIIPEIIGKPREPKYKTYFMQVCQMLPGSTFGFGENMRDRRILATKPVDCMLMPKVWLLQRNSANIWSRIQHYLEKKIPTKRQLFEEFVNQRRWLKFREQVVEEVVGRSTTVNMTTMHDVPYSIRIEEQLDI